METFNLKHITLYSKGFYKKSDDIVKDLRKCFTADNYCGEYMTINDMVGVILSHFQRIKNQRCTELLEYTSGISEDNCWKYGYRVKDNKFLQTFNVVLKEENDKLPIYDIRMAVIYYVLSSIRLMSFEEIGIVDMVAPDFKKCLPRRNGIKDKRLKEFFGRFVEKV